MTTTDITRTCRHCTQPVEYRVGTYFGDWVHAADGSAACGDHMVEPVPVCPGCGGTNIVWTVQAWGNAQDCPDCGYHAFYSIGDIAAHGVTTPLLLGDDGRVWDGHHRLFVARLLGIETLPVEYGHGGQEAG